MPRKAVAEDTGRAAAGFTLLEVMAAVAILTLLVAAALPVYRVVAAEYRLAGAAADLAAELEYAQRLAVEQRGLTAASGNLRFCVTVEPERFLLQEFPDGDQGTTLRETPFPPGLEAAVPPEGVRVLFDWRGLPDASGTFLLRDRGGPTATVGVSAAGRVAVE